MRLLIDTNILIDYFMKREPFYADVLRLKAMSAFGDVEVWATSNSFTDVFYVLNKAVPSVRIQEAFLASKPFLNICSVTGDDIYAAAEEKWPDFEDCLVARCAKKLRADYLITRDREGFFSAETTCVTLSEFFILHEQATGISYDMGDLLS